MNKKKVLALLLALIMVMSVVSGGLVASANVAHPPFARLEVSGGAAAFNPDDGSFNYTYSTVPASNLQGIVIQPSTMHTQHAQLFVDGVSIPGGWLNGSGQKIFPRVDITAGEIYLIFNGVTYPVNIYLPQTEAQLVPDFLRIDDVEAAYDEVTEGGITRYTYHAELESGNISDLGIEIGLPSTSVTAWLQFGMNPDNIDEGSRTNNLIEFTGVNLSSDIVFAVVKDTDFDVTREYLLSVAINDGSITVKIAIRTYTALDWLAGGVEGGYDYINNGFGGSASSAEAERIIALAGVLAVPGNDHVADPNTFRPTFNPTDYVTLTLDPGSTVADAMIALCNLKMFYQVGAENNYISGIGTASNNLLSEFTCGSGSGWMYLITPAGGDRWLPNLGVAQYNLNGGETIDFIYTCAYGADFGYSIWDMYALSSIEREVA